MIETPANNIKNPENTTQPKDQETMFFSGVSIQLLSVADFAPNIITLMAVNIPVSKIKCTCNISYHTCCVPIRNPRMHHMAGN